MRYTIKHPTLGYFTEMKIVEQTPILAPMELAIHAGHPPVKKGDLIGHDYKWAPQFDAFKPSQSVQYDTEADAKAQIANLRADGTPAEELGGVAAFDSCIVVPSPSIGE